MAVPVPGSLIGAEQIVPRLWLGTNASCNSARNSIQFLCINCDARSHTDDKRCHWLPLLNADGFVNQTNLTQIERLIMGVWSGSAQVLLHDLTGLGPSPLALALWLKDRQNIPLTQAYAWIKKLQPAVQDWASKAQPHKNDSVFHG
jgi:hypothetical protein